jgi:hypothetical protein
MNYQGREGLKSIENIFSIFLPLVDQSARGENELNQSLLFVFL